MAGNDRFKELTEKVIKKRRKLEDIKKDTITEFFNLGVDFTPVIIKTSKDPSLKTNYFWS